MILNKKFYKKDTREVAKDLIGKILIRKINGLKLKVMITETEAYLGKKDKASHAYNNKKTEKNRFLYESAGTIYIYIIYGIYYCFNIVTKCENKPQSVFIRAGKPIEGIEEMKKYRKKKIEDIKNLTNGPSKLCQSMKLDKTYNGKKIYDKNSGLYVIESNKLNLNKSIKSSRRINIDYAGQYREKKWRFFINNSKFCSH